MFYNQQFTTKKPYNLKRFEGRNSLGFMLQSHQLYNISTLQPSNKNLVLRQNDLAEHSVPER
jgi:hypothetical protein